MISEAREEQVRRVGPIVQVGFFAVIAEIAGQVGHVDAQLREGFAEIRADRYFHVFHRFLEVVPGRSKIDSA